MYYISIHSVFVQLSSFQVFQSKDVPEKSTTPEEFTRMTKGITTATAKAVAAGNSAQQEDVIATANLSRKAISDMLATCKVLILTILPEQSCKHHQAAKERSLLRADRTLESLLLLCSFSCWEWLLFLGQRCKVRQRSTNYHVLQLKCLHNIIFKKNKSVVPVRVISFVFQHQECKLWLTADMTLTPIQNWFCSISLHFQQAAFHPEVSEELRSKALQYSSECTTGYINLLEQVLQVRIQKRAMSSLS